MKTFCSERLGLNSVLQFATIFSVTNRTTSIANSFVSNKPLLFLLYIEHFDEQIHQNLAHDPYFSPHVITSHFVDGLKDEIRSVALVHRPTSLDAACFLAPLQEEVLLDVSTKDTRLLEGGSVNRNPFSKMNYTSTSPPRLLSGANTVVPQKSVESIKQPGLEEKLQTIKSYRRSKGSCFKCGDKWSPTHNTVSLNLVEELWQLIPDDDIESQ